MKTCAHCDGSMEGRRANARFCSTYCRVATHQQGYRRPSRILQPRPVPTLKVAGIECDDLFAAALKLYDLWKPKWDGFALKGVNDVDLDPYRRTNTPHLALVSGP